MNIEKKAGRLKLIRLEAIKEFVQSSAIMHACLDFSYHNFAPTDPLKVCLLRALYENHKD